MLTFGKAVYGSGVGRKIAEMLEVDEKDIGQQLPTAEQQYKGKDSQTTGLQKALLSYCSPCFTVHNARVLVGTCEDIRIRESRISIQFV